jgi:hypothetical protein
MKTIIDRQRIKSRARISNIMSIGGLITLLASVLLPLFVQSMAQFAFVLMVAGLGVSMVGIYFANRWVRKPRPEEMLDTALKSLTDSYHLYHYPNLPCDHVLLTPGGVVVLETIGLSGAFSYKNDKWKESMSIGRGLRYIVEEHLGDPIKATRSAESLIKDHLERLEIPKQRVPVKSVVVFTHPVVELDIASAPVPVVKVEKLRKQIPTNAVKMDEAWYQQLDDLFTSLTIKG